MLWVDLWITKQRTSLSLFGQNTWIFQITLLNIPKKIRLSSKNKKLNTGEDDKNADNNDEGTYDEDDMVDYEEEDDYGEDEGAGNILKPIQTVDGLFQTMDDDDAEINQ